MADLIYMPLFKAVEDAIEKIPEEDQLPAYKALTRYFFRDIEPQDLPFYADLVFTLAKPSLDKAKTASETGRENVRKRWEKKSEKTEKKKTR